MRDLKKLALLVRATHERREESWEPGLKYRQGRYRLTIDQAYDAAAEALSAGPEFKSPTTLLLTWSDDGLNWANEMLKEQPNEQAGADTAALAEAAQNSPN